VADPHPARQLAEKEDKRTLLQRLVEFLHPGPDTKADLYETLADAEDNEVIGAESRAMLEGVIRMADLTAGDVMVAAPRMDLVDIDAPNEEILHLVIDTARRNQISPIDHVTDLAALSVIDDGRPGPAEVACKREEVVLLAAAIDSLPARCREILILRKLRGVPQKAIAAQLGLSEQTVQVQVSRGVRRCEEFLRAHGVQP
jgi:RNA polymerase sigma factor (sigma-70 family)